MAKYIQYFRRKIVHNCSGADPENIYGEQVDAGFVDMYRRISIENETNGYDKLRLGIAIGKEFYPFEEQTEPGKGILYWTTNQLQILEGERPQIQVVDCDEGDKINIFFEGYTLRAEDAANWNLKSS